MQGKKDVECCTKTHPVRLYADPCPLDWDMCVCTNNWGDTDFEWDCIILYVCYTERWIGVHTWEMSTSKLEYSDKVSCMRSIVGYTEY